MNEVPKSADNCSPHHPEDWWARWFNDTYVEVYSHRDLESARAEVDFAARVLRLEPTDRILDLCCGNGRHARGLGDAGFTRTIGMDYSRALLGQARAVHGLEWILRGDMRGLPCRDGAFDAVVMFFTSFGYFADEREDRAVLGEIARVLASGGAFLIDYLNPRNVRETLVPHSEKTVGGRRIIEERRFVDEGRRVEKTITIESEGVSERFTESVRLYEAGQMIDLLTDAGLKPEAVYGDFDLSPHGPQSPRTIFVRA